MARYAPVFIWMDTELSFLVRSTHMSSMVAFFCSFSRVESSLRVYLNLVPLGAMVALTVAIFIIAGKGDFGKV